VSRRHAEVKALPDRSIEVEAWLNATSDYLDQLEAHPGLVNTPEGQALDDELSSQSQAIGLQDCGSTTDSS
jgi:hypothetical protein